jgi:hypothetical protein
VADLEMTLLSAICDASSVEEAYRDLSGELSVQAADRSRAFLRLLAGGSTPSIALSSHRGDEAYSRKIAPGLRSDMTEGRSGGDAARTNGP